MIVKLPREALGREIVDALNAASRFQEEGGKKWGSQDFGEELQYEPNLQLDKIGPIKPSPVKTTVRKTGLKISSCSLKKKRGIFGGQKVWKADNDPEFVLTPVVLVDHYNEVEIKVKSLDGIASGGDDEYIIVDPHDSEFADIRPVLERIISTFYSLLKLKPVECK